MRRFVLTLVLAAGCGEPTNGADAVLASYADGIVAARAAMDTLQAGVAGAADVAAVGALNDAYAAEIGAAVGGTDQAATDLGSCETTTDLSGDVADVHTATAAIDAAVAAYVADHASHTEVNHCQAALMNHVDPVLEQLDALDALQPTWTAAAPICDTSAE